MPSSPLAMAICEEWLRRLGGPSLRGLNVVVGDAPPITWYGPARLASDRPGSEACVQAITGLMAVHGRDGGRPRRLGLEVASVAAGLLAAQAAMAAGLAASRGRGAPAPSTSVLQAGLVLLSHYFVVVTGLGDAVPGPPLPAPGPPFRSADGRWFEIETLDPEGWKDFWVRVGAGDADLGRAWTLFRWRYERATCSLPARLHQATAERSLADLMAVAAAAGVSLVPLRAYTEVLSDGGVDVGSALRSLGTTSRLAAPAPAPAGLPLAGVRVVEATSRIQGPFAGMLLRMLGAEVTRVQPPGGDYGRAASTLHRGKATVTLDVSTAGGRADLLDLVAGADVFLHNWRPGKAQAWRLDVATVAHDHPHLVYAEASGWGDRQPAPEVLGTDFLVQAHAGLGHGLNPEDEDPFPSRIILTDLFGALVGATGVLAALWRREREGGAWHARSSLLAGAMALQAHVLGDLAAAKEIGRRNGRPVWGPLDRPIVTQAGTLVVSADGDEEFTRLCAACGVDPAGGPRPAVERTLAARLADGEAAAWEERLVDAGVAAAVAVEDLADVPADPRFMELFEPVDVGGVAPRSPWTFP